MTMKYRHALDDRVGEVQDDINRAAIRNIHRIKPRGIDKLCAIFCIGKKMDLVYVERMQLSSLINNSPMLVSAYTSAGHRTRIRRKLAAIDVKPVLVLRESDRKVRHRSLQRLNVDEFIKRRAVRHSMHLFGRPR